MPAADFDYKRYLASREWALLKEKVRERSKGWCERCAVAKYEQTHHVTYERIGNELLDDLMAVCKPCHEFLSAKSEYDPCSQVRLYVVAVAQESAKGIMHSINEVRPGVRMVGHPNFSVSIRSDMVSCMPGWTDKNDYLMPTP